MKKISCCVCGSVEYALFLRGKDRLHKITGEEFDIVRCKSCGLVYLNPQPDQGELEKYYPKDYGPYNAGIEGVFKDSAVTALLRKYLLPNKKTAIGRNPDSVDKSELKFLDFGCGGGEELARKSLIHPCWDFYGLDNSKIACQKTKEKGFTVFCDDQEEERLPENFFDIVNMSHVIEHVTDPSVVLNRIQATMKDGGRIIISTPNITSASFILFRSFWFALDTPRHLTLFSEKTLTRLLQKNGFRPVRVSYNAGPKVFLKSLRYFFGLNNAPIDPIIWRFFLPFSLVLAKFGLTSIMTIEAEKNI